MSWDEFGIHPKQIEGGINLNQADDKDLIADFVPLKKLKLSMSK